MQYGHKVPGSVADDHDCAAVLAALLAAAPRERAAEIAALVLELQQTRDRQARTVLTRRLRLALTTPRDRALATVVPLPPRPARGPHAVLTGREQDVLESMTTGATNREIAEQLSITEGTVKSHVKHILRKYGVRSRAAAVAVHLTAG